MHTRGGNDVGSGGGGDGGQSGRSAAAVTDDRADSGEGEDAWAETFAEALEVERRRPGAAPSASRLPRRRRRPRWRHSDSAAATPPRALRHSQMNYSLREPHLLQMS